MNARILVMAKAPIPGTVKTRLRLDPEDAARLQAALILDTVEKTRALGQTTVAGAPRDRLDRISRLLPGDVRLIPQPEGDLGERMLAATTTLFDEAPDPVLILGTDAPTLPPQTILRSAQALITHGLSIIPGVDGGYVLLGLRGAHEAVFSAIEWSTEGFIRRRWRGPLRPGCPCTRGRRGTTLTSRRIWRASRRSFGHAPTSLLARRRC